MIKDCSVCGKDFQEKHMSKIEINGDTVEMCDWCMDEFLEEQERDSQDLIDLAADMRGGF